MYSSAVELSTCGLQSQVGQARVVVGPPAQRPVVLALGVGNRQVVNGNGQRGVKRLQQVGVVVRLGPVGNRQEVRDAETPATQLTLGQQQMIKEVMK